MKVTLFRLRIKHVKTGRLRFLSHLEMAHALERAVRRAKLPYATSQGFHPHMKISFGPALPVGCGGTGEYFDLWLTEFIEPEVVLERLATCSVADLSPIEAFYVPPKEKSLTALFLQGLYQAQCGIPKNHEHEDIAALTHLLRDEMSAATITVEGKKKTRAYDLRKVLWSPPVLREKDERLSIIFGIQMSNEGSLRADAYLAKLQERYLEVSGCELVIHELLRVGLFSVDSDKK